MLKHDEQQQRARDFMPVSKELIIFWPYICSFIEKTFINVHLNLFYFLSKNVMVNIQHMLESATASSLLMVVMDIIIVIARVYPHIFSSCFRVS